MEMFTRSRASGFLKGVVLLIKTMRASHSQSGIATAGILVLISALVALAAVVTIYVVQDDKTGEAGERAATDGGTKTEKERQVDQGTALQTYPVGPRYRRPDGPRH